MTKHQLIEEISRKTGIEQHIVARVVEAFMQTVRETMSKGIEIFMRGFGTFQIKKKAAKKGRNISLKSVLVIPEHYAPDFKPCKTFKALIKKSVNEQNRKASRRQS